MSPQRLLSGLLLCLMSLSFVQAQEQSYLRMDAPTTALQTGQETVVTITGQNLPGLWVGDMVIRYDPTAVYILGTVAGSPVTPSQDLSAQSFIVVRNAIENDSLQYTFSLVSPAQPLSGTIALGTFRIYPLKAGPTDIEFYSAQLSSFTPPPEGQPVEADDIVNVSFLPVLLHLDITGDTVVAPSEATATPAPAETEMPAEIEVISVPPTAVGLVNVTAPPLETPQTSTSAAISSDTSPILLLGLGMIVIAVLGLGALYIFRRKL